MKLIIILAVCTVAVFAQRRPGGGGCRPNTTLGVTQAMCDTMRTCMDAAFPKPAAGTSPQPLTDAQRAAQKAAKMQAETTCAAQAGISTTALAAMRAQRPAAGTGTATSG